MAIFRTDEISSEELLKDFLKEVFLDDAIAGLIARHLAGREIVERDRIIYGLCMAGNTHRSRWSKLISGVK